MRMFALRLRSMALSIQAAQSGHVPDTNPETAMLKTNDAALDCIRAASNYHFFASPKDVNWGHVTVLADHAALLKRITDAI
jgi:hypothetical protein